MRFCIEVQVSKNEFPLEMRRVVLYMLKSALSEAGEGRFYNRYYDRQTPIKKDFSFSIVIPRGSHFAKEKIELSADIIKIYFTTDDKNKTGLILMNAFLMRKNKSFPLANGNTGKIKSVNQVKQELILNSSIIVRSFAGNSVVAREHTRDNNTDRYYTVEDDSFIEKLTNVLRVQADMACFKKADIASIKIKAMDDCKKVLVKHYNSYIDCTVGSFMLSADPNLLQYFYDAGLGSRTSSGFGMLNIVSQSITDEN